METTDNSVNTASVKYSNGWMLLIPRTGFAPMLLLEWLAKFSAGRNWVHKVIINDDHFSIRLNMKEEEIQECADYINANS